MCDEKTKKQISNQQRVKDELEEIWAVYPDVERTGLVEWQLWMKILREKQEAEKAGNSED